jgi:hypothetical protein
LCSPFNSKLPSPQATKQLSPIFALIHIGGGSVTVVVVVVVVVIVVVVVVVVVGPDVVVTVVVVVVDVVVVLDPIETWKHLLVSATRHHFGGALVSNNCFFSQPSGSALCKIQSPLFVSQ